MERALRGANPVFLLTLLCALVFLPGTMSVPALDRDEARFAQASKQMLETGDFVDIKFQGQPRNKKPAGIYWLQAASVALLSPDAKNRIWAYRVPSILGAWIAVLGCFAIGRRLFDSLTALVGASLLACSMALVAEALQAKTDAVLLATVVIAQLGLANAALADDPETPPGWGNALMFWAAIGVSGLIKGPIGPVVVLLTALAFGATARRWAWLKTLRPIAGVPLALAIVLPWLIAVSQSGGAGFAGEALRQDLFAKILGAQEAHGAPPGTYLVAMIATFWPASLLAPAALAAAWKQRAADAVRFCLCWLIPSWLMFELVPTKLPHYVLPTYPALALLTGAALTGAVFRRDLLKHKAARIYGLVWGALTVGLAGGLVYAAIVYSDGAGLWAVPTPLVVAAAGVAPAVLMWRRKPAVAMMTAVALSVVAVILVGELHAPRLDRLWVARSVAAALGPRPADAPPVAAVGFHEPSLVFVLGTRTLLTDAAGAAAHVLADPAALALVESRFSRDFLADVRAGGARPVALTRIEGFNYSRGDPVTLTLYRAER